MRAIFQNLFNICKQISNNVGLCFLHSICKIDTLAMYWYGHYRQKLATSSHWRVWLEIAFGWETKLLAIKLGKHQGGRARTQDVVVVLQKLKSCIFIKTYSIYGEEMGKNCTCMQKQTRRNCWHWSPYTHTHINIKNKREPRPGRRIRRSLSICSWSCWRFRNV